MKAKIIQSNIDDMTLDNETWIAKGDTDKELQNDILNIIRGKDGIGPQYFYVGDKITIFAMEGEHKPDTWFYSCRECMTLVDTGTEIRSTCIYCGEKVTSEMN